MASLNRRVTLADMPWCANCGGTGQIEGPFPLPCPECLGCKKDVRALRRARAGEAIAALLGLVRF